MRNNQMKKLFIVICLVSLLILIIKMWFADDSVDRRMDEAKKVRLEKYPELEYEIDAVSDRSVRVSRARTRAMSGIGGDVSSPNDSEVTVIVPTATNGMPGAITDEPLLDTLKKNSLSKTHHRKVIVDTAEDRIENRYNKIRESLTRDDSKVRLNGAQQPDDRKKEVRTRNDSGELMLGKVRSNDEEEEDDEDENRLLLKTLGEKNFKQHDENEHDDQATESKNTNSQKSDFVIVDASRGNIDHDRSSLNKNVDVGLGTKDTTRSNDDGVVGKKFDTGIATHGGDEISRGNLPTSGIYHLKLPSSVDEAQNKKLFQRTPDISQKVRSFDRISPDSFADIEQLPEYDLPIIKPKTSLPSSDNEFSRVNISLDGTNRQSDTIDNVVDEFTADRQMSGVVILGKLNVTRSYAVFSTTSENRESTNFVFLIPLTTLAWKRIGFDSIVIIVGSADQWQTDPLFNFILASARKLGALFIFLEPRSEKSIMISQVARLFAGNILHAAFPGADDVYLITSDADIWPIYGDAYLLPHATSILSLNSDCCAPFSHRGKIYKMLPMANVGMKIRTWRSMTQKFGESPSSIDDILTFFVREFGNVALRSVHKGDNVGWFLDQMMLSLLITSWADQHDRQQIKYAPRDVGIDRLDRNNWNLGSTNTIDDKIDSHLLLEAFVPGVWVRIVPLLRALYGAGSNRYNWCVKYYEEFQELFIAKYRTG